MTNEHDDIIPVIAASRTEKFDVFFPKSEWKVAHQITHVGKCRNYPNKRHFLSQFPLDGSSLHPVLPDNFCHRIYFVYVHTRLFCEKPPTKKNR